MTRKIIARAARPRKCSSGRFASARFRRRSFDAFVQHHDDIRAQSDLNFKGFLRREKMLGAVEVRAKRDAVVRNFAQIAEAENLEAAGVGENRARPRHETVKPAHLADELMAGTKIEMIRVGEENLNAEVFEFLLRLAFHRGGGADRHES